MSDMSNVPQPQEPMIVWNCVDYDGNKLAVMATGISIFGDYVVFYGPDGQPLDMYWRMRRCVPDRTGGGNA